LKNKTYYIILAIFSLSINQYFGNRGLFPIDSFLIFDPAFNIISGKHPFKDYWLITGPFLDYIQAFFFLVFGTNWFSYVLHASMLNMAITLFSFYFFLKIGLKNYYSFIYSIGIAILAYPSIGTPFIDHHSVIFCMMAIYSITLGIFQRKNIFLFLTPIFLTFSFFSKQIPSPYLLVLFTFIILIYFFNIKKVDKKILRGIFFGFIFCFALVLSIFFINEIPIKNFLTQYIYYPFSLGESRISDLNIDFQNLIGQFKFIYIALIPLVMSVISLIKNKQKTLVEKDDLLIKTIFLCSVGIFIYCQLLTKNQVLIFFIIPISLAYSHLYTEKYLKNKYFVYFILFIFIFSVSKYHLRFNHHKKFIELANANFDLAVEASILDKKLSGLKWITPHYINAPSKEIKLLFEAKNILSKKQERKIIVTDYQFFSSSLNNEYASPNKWYDDLSVPNKENKYYYVYKKFFLKKIKINKIKHIYFIGKHKHKMNFFVELINKNECIVLKEINELLIDFDINDCKQIL